MFARMKSLFVRDPIKETAASAYTSIVATARNPLFFERMGVPDTLDGRFDLLVLHLALVVYALRASGADPRYEQALSEYFFDDMDRNLREMGVGDMGVGKRIRKMAEAFYGRLKAYEEAVKQDIPTVRESLQRNLYRTVETPPDEDRLSEFATYVFRSAQILPRQMDPVKGWDPSRLQFFELN